MQSNWVIEMYQPLLLGIIFKYLSGVRVVLFGARARAAARGTHREVVEGVSWTDSRPGQCL